MTWNEVCVRAYKKNIRKNKGLILPLWLVMTKSFDKVRNNTFTTESYFKQIFIQPRCLKIITYNYSKPLLLLNFHKKTSMFSFYTDLSESCLPCATLWLHPHCDTEGQHRPRYYKWSSLKHQRESLSNSIINPESVIQLKQRCTHSDVFSNGPRTPYSITLIRRPIYLCTARRVFIFSQDNTCALLVPRTS